MKVTFLTWEYPPNVYGGAGVHVQNLVQGLKNKIDIEVRTLLPSRSPAAEIEETGGLRILRYPGWGYIESESKLSKVLSVFSTDLAMVKDSITGQIVHAHTWYTSLAGYYAKHLYDQRLIMTVHSLEPLRPWKKEALGSGHLLSIWAEKTGLEACDRIIAVSNSDKKDIIECYKLPPERIKVIPNGVDEQAFHRHENHAVLAKYGIRKPYVLFLGRLSRQKGIFDLVSASSKLDGRVTLVIATGAPDEEGLEEKLSRELKSHPNSVWINKMLPRNEVVALLSAASVFVAPSLYEPFGIMNLEAMACQRPVVSTRVGGITDVVLDGETGLLVPPNNPDELANAVSKIVADPKLGEHMGEAGRRRVEDRFTWDKVAVETLSVYNEVTE
jgi:glycogen synthase